MRYTYPEVQDYPRWTDCVVHEYDLNYSHGLITIVSGSGIVRSRTLLGKITASGKYAPIDPAASDGTETAAAILYSDVDATSSDINVYALLRGPAIIEFSKLELVNALTAPQEDTVKADLAALSPPILSN